MAITSVHIHGRIQANTDQPKGTEAHVPLSIKGRENIEAHVPLSLKGRATLVPEERPQDKATKAIFKLSIPGKELDETESSSESESSSDSEEDSSISEVKNLNQKDSLNLKMKIPIQKSSNPLKNLKFLAMILDYH